MHSIPLPTTIAFTADEKNAKRGQLVVEPCYAGYGTTLGNALRRVLLSSLTGAAITAVKIKGVQHEFSTVPHIREDVVEILLNLKQLRLKVHSDEPVTLTLKVSGEREVKAGDIEAHAGVDIANPDHVIATITDKAGALDMEFTAQRGRGYVPVESRDDRSQLPIGTIAIDAVYTPVVNVSYHTEHARVGKMITYDRLLLDVETDGTIQPEEAIHQAAELLINHFQVILSGPQQESDSALLENTEKEEESSEEVKETAKEDTSHVEDAEEKKEEDVS